MIGQTVSHYKILEKLGGGGMGVVYKAEDTRLKRLVALKFLPSDLTRDDDAKARFINEAQAASALDHPNICTIYEIDETEVGRMFIAMAYYEGETLKKKVTSDQLSVNSVVDIAIQIAQGLAKAHEHGITHRDLKPANVMITKDGVVKIVDFGLAKLASQKGLTKTGMTVGTAAYMSPEQAQGLDTDHRSDLWSLGVVLYEMLTSQLPFLHEYEAAIVYSILNETPTPPTELRDDMPKDLEHIALKCLQKNCKDRYSSAQQLLSDLKKLQKALESGRPEVTIAPKEKPEARKESERRQATVMFANISGYKEMLKELDPEEVAAVMNRCFAMFGEIAQKYGGTVDKIMGNCITVLFGVPQAIENAPQKAINAAIEMRNQIQQFNHENKLPISLDTQIGVNTGIVVAGNVGAEQTKEYTVIGDTVELASNLMALCTNGQIYVGPLTYRYARNEFDYRELKPMVLKGLKTPVPVFELLSVKEKIHRPQLGAERMIYSEMVGRDQELDKLKLHVLKVINGEGSIVSVIGEAGIGKSRLIAELRKVDDLKKVTLLEGRALSIGQNLSYHPLIDILKNWANITEEDNEAVAMFKLETAIGRIHPEGVAEVLPFIATMMGMELTGKHKERIKGIEGEAMEKLILKNLRELMMKGAERRPLVYILQDLHWADLTSIALLESLCRLAASHPICFINVMRPNYPETGERLLAAIKERYPKVHAEIVLAPLNETQCETLVQNLLKASGIPAEIRKTIVQRAEGNPFFIEEVVRSFIDEGALVLQNGKFHVTEKIEAVVIPETIQDVLLSRIDRLDEETKSLLKHASIIGRYFFYKILTEVTKTIENLNDRLDYLQGVQLILQSRRVEELEYLFKHALAQEVTYESILLKKRKELHLQVAHAIESVFFARLHEFYGMLALHYSKGENLEKAEEYLIKAGEEALKAAASTEALNYYQEALELYLKKSGDHADPEKIAMLEKNIGLAFYNKGYMAEALKHFDNALEYLGEKKSRNQIAEVFKFFINLVNVLKNLYWPSKKAKKVPGSKELVILDLRYKKGTVLASIDPKRLFMEAIGLFSALNKFDMRRIEGIGGMYSSGSYLFSATGISFALSRKFLEASKKFILADDVKSLFLHKAFERLHNFLAGNWGGREYQIDEELMNAYLRLGELFNVYVYLTYSFQIAIGRGNFAYAAMIINKMSTLSDAYDYDYGRCFEKTYELSYLLNQQKLYDASKFVDKSMALANKLGLRAWHLRILGIEAKARISLKDRNGAEESLRQAKQILLELGRTTPVYSKDFLVSRFLFNVYQLEDCLLADSLRNDKLKIKELKNSAHQSGKKAMKLSYVIAEKRPEVLRLMGTLSWLENKQKQAFKYWDQSIKSAEHLGARPELARTYMEVGKRLLEKKSKYCELNGISAEAYLEKARTLFQEMDLAWDLEELERLEQRA